MAAPEVRFEALGQAWRFTFGFAALCALEDETDTPFMLFLARCFPDIGLAKASEEQILRAKVMVRANDLRAIMLAGLKRHHDNVTAARVADIIDDIGIEEAGRILRQAVASDLQGGESGGKNPPRRGRRSGSTTTGSSARGAKRG